MFVQQHQQAALRRQALIMNVLTLALKVKANQLAQRASGVGCGVRRSHGRR
jgi:hypothetical protein